MSDPLVFVFPLPENRANRWAHWGARYAKRKKYWARLDLLVTLRRNPRAVRRLAKAHATVAVWTWKAISDKDNATARTKDILDWLVSRGYLVDDIGVTYQRGVGKDKKVCRCGHTVRKATKRCSHCGHDFPGMAPRQKGGRKPLNWQYRGEQ